MGPQTVKNPCHYRTLYPANNLLKLITLKEKEKIRLWYSKAKIFYVLSNYAKKRTRENKHSSEKEIYNRDPDEEARNMELKDHIGRGNVLMINTTVIIGSYSCSTLTSFI